MLGVIRIFDLEHQSLLCPKVLKRVLGQFLERVAYDLFPVAGNHRVVELVNYLEEPLMLLVDPLMAGSIGVAPLCYLADNSSLENAVPSQ